MKYPERSSRGECADPDSAAQGGKTDPFGRGKPPVFPRLNVDKPLVSPSFWFGGLYGKEVVSGTVTFPGKVVRPCEMLFCLPSKNCDDGPRSSKYEFARGVVSLGCLAGETPDVLAGNCWLSLDQAGRDVPHPFMVVEEGMEEATRELEPLLTAAVSSSEFK